VPPVKIKATLGKLAIKTFLALLFSRLSFLSVPSCNFKLAELIPSLKRSSRSNRLRNLSIDEPEHEARSRLRVGF
jgi:hypothetical protein